MKIPIVTSVTTAESQIIVVLSSLKPDSIFTPLIDGLLLFTLEAIGLVLSMVDTVAGLCWREPLDSVNCPNGSKC